jgi:hypothetical protein
MNNSSILNVYSVAHYDAIHVTSNNGIKPHAAFVAHQHVAHNGSIFREVTVVPHFRLNALY